MGYRSDPSTVSAGLSLRDRRGVRSVPPPHTDRTRNPPYGSSPYPTTPTGRVRTPKYTYFEIPQGPMFLRFVPSIGSRSQFCFNLQPHRVAALFPPTFASRWRNSFVQIHGRTTLWKAKFGTTPQKRLKNDLNWGVGSSYGTNNPPLQNPSFAASILDA